MDALVALVNKSQGEEMLAIEFKYSDRFNSRKVMIDRPPYRALAGALSWRDTDAVLSDSAINQLVRCHAIAGSMAPRTPRPNASLLVVHHSEDTLAPKLAGKYRGYLGNGDLVQTATLNTWVSAMGSEARSPAQRVAVAGLALRYVREEESDVAWQGIDGRRKT